MPSPYTVLRFLTNIYYNMTFYDKSHELYGTQIYRNDQRALRTRGHCINKNTHVYRTNMWLCK